MTIQWSRQNVNKNNNTHGQVNITKALDKFRNRHYSLEHWAGLIAALGMRGRFLTSDFKVKTYLFGITFC